MSACRHVGIRRFPDWGAEVPLTFAPCKKCAKDLEVSYLLLIFALELHSQPMSRYSISDNHIDVLSAYGRYWVKY